MQPLYITKLLVFFNMYSIILRVFYKKQDTDQFLKEKV